MALYMVGETDLDLKIIGAGLRDGSLPSSPDDELWAAKGLDLTPLEMRDLKAFGAAGWHFLPIRGFDWSRLRELNLKPRMHTGLLARHPSGGLVILQDRILLKVSSKAAMASVKDRLTKSFRLKELDLGENLFEARLRLPDEGLDGAIQDELEFLLSRPRDLGDVVFAEPSLLYHVARKLQPYNDRISEVPSWLHGLLAELKLDFSTQWHWEKIKLEEAWKSAKTSGKGVRVGVIDCGFDTKNPEIPKVAWSTYLNQEGVPIQNASIPYGEHGTACAGLIGAATGNGGINGAAPECDLILVSLPPHGCVTQAAVAKAVRLCAEGSGGMAGADVISCSLGLEGSSWELGDALREAIDFACNCGRKDLGTPIVWAVFNDDEEIKPKSLEAYDPVLCVAQSDKLDKRVDSGFGKGLDLIAPGLGVRVLVWDESGWRVDKKSGSSLAAPCTAGVAALLLSVHDSLTCEQVIKILTEKCDRPEGLNDWSPDIGWGRLNAEKAVETALQVKQGVPL